MKRRARVATVGLLACLAFLQVGETQAPKPPPTAAAGEGSRALAALRAAMDPSADPCQDFYRYACGSWQDTVKRPPHEPSYLRSFTAVRLRSREVRRTVLEKAASAGEPEGTFYASCMDETTIEARGAAPLAPYLAEIADVQDLSGLFRSAGHLQRLAGVGALIGLYVARDKKAPERWQITLIQGGLGLPDRSYYLDKKSDVLRAAYLAHLSRLLALSGESKPSARESAAKVVAFETRLARAARPREALRDAEATYHKEAFAGLEALDPDLPWPAFFQGVGHAPPKTLNLATPEFVGGLGAALRATAPDTWRAYLRAHLLIGSAGLLSKAFVEERFSFRRVLTGQAALRPRWERCVDATTRAFRERVGRGFVQAAFTGESKTIAEAMAGGVERAFEDSLPDLAWMDAATRKAALVKARQVGNHIGHPDVWHPEHFAIRRNQFFENAEAGSGYDVDRDLAKSGEPVDPDEWQVAASMVNAFYSPTGNRMVFPAGILQPPFFHRDFPLALNYGAIGAVVGHELTHGFDDQGRKYDGRGMLQPWWSEPVAQRFNARTQCLVDQFDAYEPQPKLHVNGRLTLGENIADLGGLKAAWRAFEALPETQRGAGSVHWTRPELTPEQLFFVGFGQMWCADVAEEYERLMLRVNPHSPSRFRVNGTLRNLPAFGRAFSCKVGSDLRPEKPCEVW